MIYAFDTYYKEEKAKTVCIGFKNWGDAEYSFTEKVWTAIEDEYISGQFYRRELPCILELLKKVPLEKGDIIVVDSFVFLDDDKKLGLGGYLYERLEKAYPVVGVGKNDFVALNLLVRAVYRGKSKKPLYVTAAGLDLEEAAKNIQHMFGEFRTPELLKQLDQMTRKPQ